MKKLSKLTVILVCGSVLCGCSVKHKQDLAQLLQDELSLMVKVPGGEYMMGPKNPIFQNAVNTPRHRVVLPSFYISKHNASYAQYDQYSKLSETEMLDKKYLKDFFRGSKFPVNNISWYQAKNYCNYLKNQTGLPMDLPTEAQWEYVARNQGKDNWYYATDTGKIKLNENYPSWQMLTHQKNNLSQGGLPLPVGSIPCTSLGVCGMNNSVNQWVNDWYDPAYYSHSRIENPEGPKLGKTRSLRGAGATSSYVQTNNYRRTGIDPKKSWAGFRCVINSALSMPQLKAKALKRIDS